VSGDRKKYPASVANVVSLVLISFPIFFAFLYVYLFGVNVPFGDVWVMVPRFDKLFLGTLSFSDLWVQHFEHRIFFPRVTLLLVGLVAQFDQVVVMYLIQTCFVASVIVLLLAFRKTVGPRLLLFVPVPFLVLNLGQYFNIFNGMQIAFAFAQVFSIAAFYLLYVSTRNGTSKPAFAAAITSGLVATFSLLAGLFVWPVGFLQLLVSPVERSVKKILVGIWSLVWIVAWAGYFFNWSFPERQGKNYIFESSSLGADFFLTALGSPLAWWGSPALSLVCGILLAGAIVVSLVLVYRAGKLGEHSFWLALIAFSLIFLLSLTVGRSGGGIVNALSSRYITFTVLSIVGAYTILAKLAIERSSRVAVFSFGAIFVLVVASIPFSYVSGVEKANKVEAKKKREAATLSTYSSQPLRDLRVTNRRPEKVKQYSFVLCKLDYTVFSESGTRRQNCLPPRLSTLSVDEASTFYRVTSLAGVRLDRQEQPIRISAKKSSIRVTGWAVDLPNRKPAGGIYLKIDDKTFPAFYGRHRPDINKVFKAPIFEFSGFEQTIPISEIGPGTHELSVMVVTNDGERYYQPGRNVTFEVIENSQRNR
jgi:large-conductance mechanosensitive channel